jgi:ferredoxin
MKTTIFYFSSTGNSLAVARQIAEKLGDSTLVSMAKKPPIHPLGGPSERIGFVFPVYFFGLPRLVKHCIENLRLVPQTSCFGIVTYGGEVVDTLGMLEDTLGRKGCSLQYAEKVKMPGNYIAMYQAYPDPKIKRQLDAAAQAVDRIADEISKGVRKPARRHFVLFSRVVNGFLYRNIPAWDKPFFAGKECTHCGLCVSVCPVGNISLEGGAPVWLHNCERCCACIQWCPVEAIQRGKKTAGRRRYRHPGVKVADIVKSSSKSDR